MCSRSPSQTFILKSPDSEKVREVIVTSVLLPKSENENLRTVIPMKCYRSSNEVGLMMEKRNFKRKLDHLSLEEKILRKKLKNREAAQTSRDKKKARLEELESTVVELQSQNESLFEDVRSLKDEKERLVRENAELREEVFRLSIVGGTSGPAASCPLPQGVSPPPVVHRHSSPILPFLIWMTLASTLMTGTGLTLKNLNDSKRICLLKLLIQKKQKQRKKIWWGRRQKAWNPVGPV